MAEAGARFGLIVGYPDADGTYRRLPLVAKVGAAYVPGLALAALLGAVGRDDSAVSADFNSGQLVISGAVLPSGEKRDLSLPLLPDGSSPASVEGSWADSFVHYEAARLVAEEEGGGSDLASILRDSVVVLTDLTPGVATLGPLPYDATAPLSLLVSSWLSAAIHDDLPRPVEPRWAIAFAALLALLVALSGFFDKAAAKVASGAGAFVLPLFLPLLALSGGVILPGGSAAIAVAVGMLVSIALAFVGDLVRRNRLVMAVERERYYAEVGRRAEEFGHDMKGLAELAANLGTLIAAETDPARRKELAALQLRAIGEVAATARGIMTLLKFSERDREEAATVDLSALVQGLVSLRRFGSGEGPVEMAAIMPRLPVFCRPAGISNAIEAIVDNAVEVSAPDGKRVVVEAGEEAGFAYVRVVDRGPGFPACAACAKPDCTDCPSISRGRTTKAGGRGLGLYGARKAAEEAGGFLRIRNGETGAAVSIHLPMSLRLPA